MSKASQFMGGNLPPKAIVNAYSTTGYTPAIRIDTSAPIVAAKIVNSGALTAATLATILSITGAGTCEWLGAWANDATSRTMRMQVTIDGVVAYDATSAASAAFGNGPLVIGSGTTGIGSTSTVTFKQSFDVKVASSLTETDKLTIGYKYYTT